MGRQSREMEAAIITAPGHASLARVAQPEPGPRELRIRLEGCGVCGSNLAPWEGRPWFTYPLSPGELGHEGWGEVDAVGDEVQHFRPGDRVAMLWYHAYAQYDVAPESAVVRLPPSLDRKPFPGEALGCAMNVFQRCQIKPGQTVAIVGIGFLGAVLTSLSARAGARVIALSRRTAALEATRKMGAAEVIQLVEDEKAIQQVKELTANIGCDRVIEATGKQGPLNLAGELTCERGRLIIAGYHQDGLRQVNLQLWNWRGLDVINAHERDPRIYTEGIQAAVEAVANGNLDPMPLLTHQFRLAELASALNAMKDRPNSFLKAFVTV